ETLPISFTFTKPVSGLSAAVVTVSGGTLTEWTGTGLNYTATFTPAPGPGGNATIAAGAGLAVDASGNPSLAASSLALKADPAAAATVIRVTAVTPDGAYRAGTDIVLQVVFSGVVTVTGNPTLALDFLPPRTATYSGGSGTPALNFKYTVQAGDRADDLDYAATNALSLNEGTVVNLSGSPANLTLPARGGAGALAVNANLRIDTAAPQVKVTSDRLLLKAGQTARLDFTLTEASTDFSAADVVVSNGTLSGFSGSGAGYSAVFTPAADLTGTGLVRVPAGTFTDAAGNANLAAELSLANDIGFAWARTWGASGRDQVLATGIDADGNVYSAGRFTGTVDFDPGAGVSVATSAGDADGFVTKFDRQGNFLWVRTWGGAGTDEVRALAVDATGGVYLAGSFSGTMDLDPGVPAVPATAKGANDLFVVKLNAAGQFQWGLGLGGSGPDEARALAVDAVGSVYVGGAFSAQVDFDPGAGTRMLGAAGANDGFVLKLDPSGALMWAITLGGKGSDQINALALDARGEIYVAGVFSDTVDFDPGPDLWSLTSAGGTDGFVAKFDGSGALVWARTLGGTGDDTANALAVS
ncbi:MAG: Ig-like domain-containing protein, partial [Verrucomicrobiota bacterium]